MEFIEFILFIIGCILSYITGIFLYAFIAGIISGIFLVYETRKNNSLKSNENINPEEKSSDNIKEEKENIDVNSESNVNSKQQTLNMKVRQLIEESIEFEKSIKETREKLNDIYNSLC